METILMISRLSVDAYRCSKKNLDKMGVDYIALFDTIENTYDINIKTTRKILISRDKEKTSILLTADAVYITIDTTEYDTITMN